LTGVTLGKDGIPFGALGQSQIAAMLRAYDAARLWPACSTCFFRRRTGGRSPDSHRPRTHTI